MRITVTLHHETGLFLHEEMGDGTLAGEPVKFGHVLPSGTPYVFVRGKYYTAPKLFETMLRAVHGQKDHVSHGDPCDEHTTQPVSTPEQVAEIARAFDAGQ